MYHGTTAAKKRTLPASELHRNKEIIANIFARYANGKHGNLNIERFAKTGIRVLWLIYTEFGCPKKPSRIPKKGHHFPQVYIASKIDFNSITDSVLNIAFVCLVFR